MCMADKEKIVEKVQKLLKLGNSPFDEEAKTALQKARELMLKYHIEEHDLQGEQKEQVISKEIEVDKAVLNLYAIIATNNRCDSYIRYQRIGRRKYRYCSVIVGFPFDVECVETMGKYVSQCFLNGLRIQRAEIRSTGEYEDTRGLKAYYHRGFIEGLQKAFKEQNDKQEFHLMVITPQEVKDEIDKLNLTHGAFHTVSNPSYSNRDTRIKAHQAGYSDGYSAGKSSSERPELTS